MIKRSSSLLKLRMWSTLRTIRTQMLPRILMDSKTIPHKVGMLVPLNKALVGLAVQVPSKAQVARKTVLAQVLVVPNKVPAVQVLSKALVARKTALAQVLAVPNKVLAVQVLSKAQVARKMALALVLVVPSRVLVAQVLSKALAARKTVLVLVLVAQVLSKAQVAKKMVRALVRAARKMVLVLAERPARRMNISLIKRRNSRSMTGEK